ncbi:facilitated trehalose transporter Tret1-like isoform X2 [Camponotus floridanus]|uniref:facilitated trehalose transporter Tret1-like isoform X2 n=1 Tax=Camponotus floridanus TaxID=104421 RepID=UPI000DC6B787|nr:facilitated trehalose transporter Tret1-like isoform X2 [Camponotus floridanus]
MKKVYLAAVAGNLGMLTVGQYFGWALPSLPILVQGKDETYPVRLTSEEASWVASLLILGTITASIICAFIVNIIGRKNIMLFAAVPSIISWLMIAFATSSWELYISRFLAGLSTGFTYTVTPIYIGEISPANIRGNFGSMLTVISKIGTTLEYVIGPFLSVKHLALVSLIGPCLFFVIFVWLPESPYHLMRRNAKEKALNSLVQLRGKEDVHEEIDTIERSVKIDLANKSNLRELFCIPGNRRALITVVSLSTIHQLSGVQAVEQYAQLMFNEMNNNLESKYLIMILGAVQVISTIVCMFITDRSGRKLLLIISAIGSACSTAMVATYFNLQHNNMDTSNLQWLSTVGVIMYVIMFSVGLSVLPFTMIGELFPMNIKALGSTVKMIIIGILAFGVTKLYLVIADNLGIHVSFWIFTGCSLAGALFTLIYVPETKEGLSNVEM